MQLKIFDNKESKLFYDQNYSFWIKNEDANGVLMSIAKRGGVDNIYFSVVDDQKEIELTACLTSKDQLLISQSSIKSLLVLSSYLESNKLEVPGIFAPNPISIEFAKLLSNNKNLKYKIVKSLGHYSLTKLMCYKLALGNFQHAKLEDKETLIAFRDASQKEENNQRQSDSRKAIDFGLEQGTLYTWKNNSDEVVCMGSLFFDRSPSSGYINGIYTPPTERGKGYASAMTYSLCKLTQEKSLTPRLSVDIENTGAISIYEKLGFMRKCQMDNIRFNSETSLN